MDQRLRNYGVVAFVVGAGLFTVGEPVGLPSLTAVGGLLAMAGVGAVGLSIKKRYCAACGQVLGRGGAPGRCHRCGSNRTTLVDPGAKR